MKCVVAAGFLLSVFFAMLDPARIELRVKEGSPLKLGVAYRGSFNPTFCFFSLTKNEYIWAASARGSNVREIEFGSPNKNFDQRFPAAGNPRRLQFNENVAILVIYQYDEDGAACVDERWYELRIRDKEASIVDLANPPKLPRPPWVEK